MAARQELIGEETTETGTPGQRASWRSFAGRYPVVAFVGLCYAITWSVWLAIPFVLPEDPESSWPLIKILTGVGLGPGLAAVLLDRWRGTAGRLSTPKGWAAFSLVFALVALVNLSSLLTGDAPGNRGFAMARPPGLSAVGVVGSLLAAAVCGFIFASAVTSRTRPLASILRFRAGVFWWLVALFLPAVMALASLAVTRGLGGELPPWPLPGLTAEIYLFFIPRAILFTLLVVAVGEEPGWRGWMLPELQKRYNPLVSTLVVGFVWGLWHLPLFVNGLYPGGPKGIAAYFLLCPILAVVFTWLYNRTAGNLLLALVLHTTINTTPRFLPAAPSILWLGLALALLLILTERMWQRPVRGRDPVVASPPHG